jgi:hypothetical protein
VRISLFMNRIFAILAALVLSTPVFMKAQAVNGGLAFPTSAVINNVLLADRGFQLPGAFTAAIGSSSLNTLNLDGTINGLPGGGTVNNSIQWEGNTVGVTCTWSFTTDQSGQILFNFTMSNAGSWHIFSPKDSSKNYSVPTGVRAGLLSGTVSPLTEG